MCQKELYDFQRISDNLARQVLPDVEAFSASASGGFRVDGPVLKRIATSLALCCAALGAHSPADAAGVGLQSYVAYYRMSMESGASSREFSGLDGYIAVEWKRVCGGYAFRQRLSSEYVYASGEEGSQELGVSSWESSDGTVYRFHLTDANEEGDFEEFKGRAVLSPDSSGGYADFAIPEGQSVRIPKGAAFPTVFSNEILSVALAGRRAMSRTVFDGLGEDPMYDTVVFIGDPLPAETASHSSDPGKVLNGIRSWPVAVAYFIGESRNGAPSYEMSARLFENGVATELRYDYGNLVIRGALEKIEPIDEERCARARR